MKKQIILHIPHSSVHIPNKEGYTVDDDIIRQEILKLTDWHTEDLFHSKTDIMVTAPFSRVFCDTERFADDSQELMAKFGMGVCYERSDDGKVIRNMNESLKERIIAQYYQKHHDRFRNAVTRQLEGFGQALILDCHSFPSIPLIRDLDQNPDRPDFNIGTDPYHTPAMLIEFSKEFFDTRGYSLGIDVPYSGSIVPLEFYNKKSDVISIMLEVNRKLYLKEPSNEKSEGYTKTKKVVQEYIDGLRTFINKYQ